MMDACEVGSHADGAKDRFGHRTDGYTWGAAIRCGLSFYAQASGSDEVQSGEVEQTTHILRLPKSASIKARDRVRVTARFGETLTAPLLFDVVGPPLTGPSGTVVNLRQVTG